MTLAILPIACAKGLTDIGGAGGGASASASSGQPASSGSGNTSSSSSSGASSSGASSASASSSSASSSGASSSSAGSSSASASSGSGSSSSGGVGGGPLGCPPSPSNLQGCPGCGAACDSPWPASWSAVPGATYYLVEYTCLVPNQYQTMNTSVDLCAQVGMCNNNLCANGAGPVTVKACNNMCCSAPALVPAVDTPIACGGGVCC